MEDYIDEFSELIDEAGYTDGLSRVMKFQKGFDRDIQDHVAEMVQGRPEDNDPDGWYEAARMFDANRAANQAFHRAQRAVVPTPSTRTTLPISKMFPPAQTPFTMPPCHTPECQREPPMYQHQWKWIQHASGNPLQCSAGAAEKRDTLRGTV